MKYYSYLALLLLVSPYAAAEKTVTTTSYKSEREASRQLHETVEKTIVPMSKSLAYLLTNTLPANSDGKHQPLSLSIKYADIGDFDVPTHAIVYHCAFGAKACKTFFESCAALYLNCTGDSRP
jgi:hypothetical protein